MAAEVRLWGSWAAPVYDEALNRLLATASPPEVINPPRSLFSQEAAARATALFKRCLSAEQGEQWDRNEPLDIVGSLGRPYRIEWHYNFNIVPQFEVRGFAAVTLCAEPLGGFWPLGDYLLHQKLWLENDEEALLRVANIAVRYDPGAGFVTLPAAAAAYIPC